MLACNSLSSCSEESGSAGDLADDMGSVALDMQLDPLPVGSEVEASRSSSLLVSLHDLILTLTDKDRKKVTTHTVDDFSESKEIRTGSYKLEATFGTKGEEGWGKLFCYGLQEFRVRLGKLTEVNLPVTMANSMVEISYSDAFNDYLTDVSTSVITEAGNSFDWAGDHTEDLYISPGTFSVSVSFTKPNGMSATAVVGPYTAEAKHQYAVNLDVDYASAEQIVLTIDDTVTEKEETIDISDENLPALMAAPEVTLSEGYTLRQVIEMIEHDPVTNPLIATVTARGRIVSAVLTTQSPDLVEVGFPASVDLCNPGSDTDKLKEMGLDARGFSGTGSVFGIIDFTRLLSNIPYRENGSSESVFRLTVKDAQDNEVTYRLFTVNLTQLELSVPHQGQLTAEGSATISVECNAKTPVFEALARSADSGAWNDLTVSSVTKSGVNAENGNTVYTLNLTGDVLTYDRQINVKIFVADQRVSVEDIIHVPSTRIEAAKTNAFAKSAYLTVLYTTDEAAAEADKVTFEVSTNGSTFTPVTAELVTPPGSAVVGQRGVYRLTGLTPGTKYSVRSIHDGEKSRTVSITTEVADESLNTGFDEWTKTQLGDFQYLWTIKSDKLWNTVNELTTSTYGSGHSMTNHKGAAYCATSGTIPANGRSNYSNRYGGLFGTDQKADGHTQGVDNLHSDLSHTGANAALIRTVGYGSENTAGAGTGNPASGFATCQHVATGELYLGTYDNGPIYSGCDFGSRPVSVTFYYKYVSYGSSGDYGDCEVIVYDATGEKITGSGVTEIKAQADYAPMTLTLDYPVDAKKAAKIMIRFKSSANPGLTNNSTWLYGPGNKNLSGGEYLGSELYIDDITFNY